MIAAKLPRSNYQRRVILVIVRAKARRLSEVNMNSQKLACAIGMIGLAYFAFEYDSVLCGIGAFLLFLGVAD